MDSSVIIDSIAITGAILIAIFLIISSMTNPNLFNNPNYDNMLNELIIGIVSIISYTVGKNVKKNQ
jgi:hypothetical protein